MPQEDVPWLKVANDCLYVRGHLDPHDLNTLAGALRQFIEADRPSYTIDLTAVDYMSSSYLGLIAASTAALVKRERSLRVRAQGQILRLLKLAGVDKVADVEEVQGWTVPPFYHA